MVSDSNAYRPHQGTKKQLIGEGKKVFFSVVFCIIWTFRPVVRSSDQDMEDPKCPATVGYPPLTAELAAVANQLRRENAAEQNEYQRSTAHRCNDWRPWFLLLVASMSCALTADSCHVRITFLHCKLQRGSQITAGRFVHEGWPL